MLHSDGDIFLGFIRNLANAYPGKRLSDDGIKAFGREAWKSLKGFDLSDVQKALDESRGAYPARMSSVGQLVELCRKHERTRLLMARESGAQQGLFTASDDEEHRKNMEPVPDDRESQRHWIASTNDSGVRLERILLCDIKRRGSHDSERLPRMALIHRVIAGEDIPEKDWFNEDGGHAEPDREPGSDDTDYFDAALKS